MKRGDEGLRMCIFVHESLRHDHIPLYEALVESARREGLASATVIRGIEGFGLHRHLHASRLIDISDDLPIIVEIVDIEVEIRGFLRLLDDLIPHGTVTLSPVRIYTYSQEATR